VPNVTARLSEDRKWHLEHSKRSTPGSSLPSVFAIAFNTVAAVPLAQSRPTTALVRRHSEAVSADDQPSADRMVGLFGGPRAVPSTPSSPAAARGRQTNFCKNNALGNLVRFVPLTVSKDGRIPCVHSARFTLFLWRRVFSRQNRFLVLTVTAFSGRFMRGYATQVLNAIAAAPFRIAQRFCVPCRARWKAVPRRRWMPRATAGRRRRPIAASHRGGGAAPPT
jgi:hypothetical protein